MSQLQRIACCVFLISALPSIVRSGDDGPRVVESETFDFSGFERFELKPVGGCIADEPGVISLTIRKTRDDFVVSLRSIEALSADELEIADECEGRRPCLVEVDYAERRVTDVELAAIEERFGEVTFETIFDPICQRIFLCGYNSYEWQSIEGEKSTTRTVSDAFCIAPSLADKSFARLDALTARLRRGSQDCNQNDVPDAFDISSGVVDDFDEDGLPDDCEQIDKKFHRGDPNASGRTDLADAVFLFSFLFLGGQEPGCAEAADTNDDSELNITDGILLLNYLFLGGPPPEPPSPSEDCDFDGSPPGSPGALGCSFYDAC